MKNFTRVHSCLLTTPVTATVRPPAVSGERNQTKLRPSGGRDDKRKRPRNEGQRTAIVVSAANPQDRFAFRGSAVMFRKRASRGAHRSRASHVWKQCAIEQVEDRCMLAVPLEVTGAPSLNVRSGPSIDFPVLTTIDRGQQFVSADQSNGWNHIDLPSQFGPRSGWVSGAYTTEAPQATRVEVQGTSGLGLRIRTGPGTSYPPLDHKLWDSQQFITFAQSVAGDGCSHPWYQIYLPADSEAPSGWGCGDYLTVMSSTAAPDPVPPSVTVDTGN